jgi:hypothetical protein
MTRGSFVLLATLATAMVGACSGDRNTYPASVAEVKQKLVGKQASYKLDTQTRFIRVGTGNGNSLSVEVGNDRSFNATCSIGLEAVSETSTRVIPDCGSVPSAVGETTLGMLETEVAELTKQILTGTPVDVAYMRKAGAANFAKNLPKMQGEALAADAQMRKMGKEIKQHEAQAEAAADGWGGGAASSDEGGWGSE